MRQIDLFDVVLGLCLVLCLLGAFIALGPGCSQSDAPPAACPVQQQQKNTCPLGGCPGRWEKDGSYRVDGKKKLDFEKRKPTASEPSADRPAPRHMTGFIPIPESEFRRRAKRQQRISEELERLYEQQRNDVRLKKQ